MTAFASRPYAGAEDLQSMIDLLMAVRPAERITDYPSIIDLQEALGMPALQENTRLWVDAEGQLVSFAFVDLYHNLRFEIAPQAGGNEIESQIVAWGVECIRRAIHESGEAQTLDASCRDDDTERIALLERHGFETQEMRTLRMVRPLNEPIPAPQVPLGFSIRHVVGEHEVEEVVALHRAAFGTENMTVEERLSMMRVPEYDPELDLFAVAPDGEFAAYCTCSISQRENISTGRNEGYADTIATHPDFQRRGLARALLLTELRLLKERGVDMAVLGTSSENIAMQQAARAVGFGVQSTTLWFAKPIPEHLGGIIAMTNGEVEEPQVRRRWRRASELPPEVFAILRKPNRAINPVTIVATVDPDGTPRTAPFGSVRAVTPRLLRMACLHYHDTYANLCRDGRVMVALVAPPNIAVSIRGQARVVREQMNTDERSAILEIDVEEVKNDMVAGDIGSAITFFPRDEHQGWFEAALAELEEIIG